MSKDVNPSQNPNNQLTFEEREQAANLMKAVLFGDIKKVKIIIKANPKLVHAQDKDRYTPLLLATEHEHIEIVRFLIEINYTVIKDTNKNGCTALMIAACYNTGTEIIKLLIKKDPNMAGVRDITGWTALMYATGSGNIEKVKILVKVNPIMLHAQNKEGYTPLLLAAEHEHIEIVRFLIEFNYTVIKGTNKNGCTALMIAARYNTGTEITNLLIEKDSHIAYARDINDWTALMYAADSGDIKKVIPIIQAAQDQDMVNVRDKEGMTALMISACGNNHAEVANTLIRNHAFYTINDIGWSALTYALCNGNTKVAKILIKNDPKFFYENDYQFSLENIKDLESPSWPRYRNNILNIAMICYTKALTKNSKNPLTYNGIGIVYYLQGMFLAAISNFNEAIKLDPSGSYYNFLTNRGLAYEKLGQIDDANKDFERAKTIQPNLKHAYLQNAMCYEQSADYDFAIEFYNIALRFDPSNEKIKNKIAEFVSKSPYINDEKLSTPRKKPNIGSCIDNPKLATNLIEEYYQ